MSLNHLPLLDNPYGREYSARLKQPKLLSTHGVDTNQPQRSSIALMCVMLVHMAAIYLLAQQNVYLPVKLMQAKPMMASLIAPPAPTPEVVPVIEPPKPEPPKPIKKRIVKKIVPEAVVPIREAVELAEPESEVPQQAPAQITPVEPAPIAKAPPQIEEKIEPPRFGVAYLNNPAPEYPSMSRRLGEEGRAIMRVLVSAQGLAEEVQIEHSSGFERLDAAAVEAVKKWRFVPAKKNNQPLSAFVLVPIKFSLNS